MRERRARTKIALEQIARDAVRRDLQFARIVGVEQPFGVFAPQPHPGGEVGGRHVRQRHVLAEDAFAELRIWRVPKAVRGSSHRYKYSLALVVAGKCVLRYDNEAGKGDHRHAGGTEAAYKFTAPEALLQDFWRDVDRWREG